MPTATGNPTTVGDVTFEGTLNRTALRGANEADVPATIQLGTPDYSLEIKDSKVYAVTGMGTLD